MPFAEVISPCTSTKALFFTFATETAVTGTAEEVSAALTAWLWAFRFTSTLASDCSFTSPVAVIFPFLFTVTEAVLYFNAHSASILIPRSFNISLGISDSLKEPHCVVSIVVRASAERSAFPSVTIEPSITTWAFTLVFKAAAMESGIMGDVVSLSETARRMMSPLWSSATAVRPTPAKVASVTVPSLPLAFTRPVKSMPLLPVRTAPFFISILAAPSTMPLRVLIRPATSMFPSGFSFKSCNSLNLPLFSPASVMRFPKLAISLWN